MLKYMHSIKFAMTVVILLVSTNVVALTYRINNNSDVIGQVQITTVAAKQSFGDIAKKFDVGVYDMIEANPGIDPWAPKAGTKVVVPTKFILPKTEHIGVVINLAEMRIYYFHPNSNLVSTYPIGIGRKGWKTPLSNARVIDKAANPTWTPPASIRREHEKNGNTLPAVVPPGPDNPLGHYAIRLSLTGYLIHGTNRVGGIGVRSSSGCIRLFPQDIEELFYLVKIGTPVKIIHEPFKVGMHNNKLYAEVHQPLSDPYYNSAKNYREFMQELFKLSDKYSIKWDLANEAIDNAYGYPVPIQ
jgi:L,D-transpeptidase ErfK/SrfK